MRLQNFLGINLLVRLKNPLFWVQVVLAVFMPVLVYFGVKWEQLTTWSAVFSLLWKALQNPVVVVSVIVAIWNTVTDPTTSGPGDSALAKTYLKPKQKEEM